MKVKDITLTNIHRFITGNFDYLRNVVGELPQHLVEQVAYRESLCPDCLEKGECQHCGCSLPMRWFAKDSCNDGERFPDMMGSDKWEEFKKEHNLKFN